MKTLILAVLLGAAAVTPASAEDRYLSVDEIASITGMRPLEVRMMLGAWSTNRYYRAGFEHVSRRWHVAVAANGLLLGRGRDAAGNPVVLVRRATPRPVA